MCPSLALVPQARAALLLIFVMGYRCSSEKKLFSRKSGLRTSCLNHSCSSTPDGGRLLEWQLAQLSAKTILPCLRMASSLVRYSFPPGASSSRKDFSREKKLMTLVNFCCVATQ